MCHDMLTVYALTARGQEQRCFIFTTHRCVRRTPQINRYVSCVYAHTCGLILQLRTQSQRTAQLLCRTCKTQQLTFSAYCRSTSLRTAFTFAMALAAYDWLVWQDRAASFLRAHPREVALQLTWGQRLVVPGAREAYAVATYEREAMGRSLGAAPCNLCGCWTHSWCEACKTRPHTAICSACDAAKLLCQSCTSCHQLV